MDSSVHPRVCAPRKRGLLCHETMATEQCSSPRGRRLYPTSSQSTNRLASSRADRWALCGGVPAAAHTTPIRRHTQSQGRSAARSRQQPCAWAQPKLDRVTVHKFLRASPFLATTDPSRDTYRLTSTQRPRSPPVPPWLARGSTPLPVLHWESQCGASAADAAIRFSRA